MRAATQKAATTLIVVTAAMVAAMYAAPCYAQSDAPALSADSLFALSKWSDAARAYAKITASDPADGHAWQNLGESDLQQRRFDEAATAFAKASEVKFRPLINVVNQARVYAERGDKSHAMALLDQVAASERAGSLRPIVLSSTEFQRYAHDARFAALIARMQPCLHGAYTQFDFWIGDWNVIVNGKPAGHNVVTREQEGCLLVEHWTSSTGKETGSSFNYYDVRDKKWHQLYIDNSGNAGDFPAMAGSLVDGKMVMLTDSSVSPLSRWTWYVMAPGKVKQMAESSTDHGVTWRTTWDSDYIKKKD